MGLLKSKLFTTPENDPSLAKLEACLVSDAAHITKGSRGDHVKKIQTALNRLSAGQGRENFKLNVDGIYGGGTAAAVKAYKNAPQRQIITRPSQKTADDIVGKRTIKSLDDEMDILESETTGSRLVSTTELGSGPPHDHNTCPSFLGDTGERTFVNHFGTPINPQGGGRKINLGGLGETKYLGFEDFVPNPVFDPPRPLTSTIVKDSVSDICLRDSPILKDGSQLKGRQEILRIAQPGCRLTFLGDPRFLEIVRSMGTVIEDIVMDDPRFPGDPARVLVLVIQK